jgi:hypothetical protein
LNQSYNPAFRTFNLHAGLGEQTFDPVLGSDLLVQETADAFGILTLQLRLGLSFRNPLFVLLQLLVDRRQRRFSGLSANRCIAQ